MIIATPREDATVILTMDVSGSMRATDVSPTRLDAARASALSFIDQLPENVRVGIVSFASEPVTLVSPTADRGQLKAAIDSLTARDGTAMGDALMQVLDIAEKIQTDNETETPDASATPSAAPPAPRRPRREQRAELPTDQPSNQPLVAAILLSDGANSVGQTEPLDAAPRAKTLGVPIYTIALGTPNRTRSTSATTSRSGRTPSTCRRTPRRSSRSPRPPAGRRSPHRPPRTSKAVYNNLQSRIGYTEERQEVTFALVAAGLLLVVVGAGLSAVWFGRLP